MFNVYKENYPNFTELVQQLKSIADSMGIFNDPVNYPDGQIAIQTNEIGVTDWQAGVGKSTAKTPDWEHSFKHLQPELAGTVVADYLEWLAVPVYRTRIMLSRPKSCYSTHRDYSPRLHLPLVTNEQCKFLFTKPARLIHMPADGNTYWVDTRHEHTFLNGSIYDRLHLVMIVEK
jgi:hypothetical protein